MLEVLADGHYRCLTDAAERQAFPVALALAPLAGENSIRAATFKGGIHLSRQHQLCCMEDRAPYRCSCRSNPHAAAASGAVGLQGFLAIIAAWSNALMFSAQAAQVVCRAVP